ncbi:MAG: 3-hydroxyacyl-CoA dehydrogenase NAD-binding domain-containing protein [Pseudomonadota bacterium]|jgi:3-hydroxyacyl-CoA dehydrogenase|nr:3-hydroxyacyl-CoA dehydrogenase NAD-binding domain-containing protein [Pseudomonadota bacterium]MEC7485981.1 3-hydroxyacyl-CoA dehydrogenase NAD-binding domain-containing protein [Pseudomonadota bacterium]MEC8245158.1 3-hydroxyacyl-CoA dehydrogenase NAD-binding domain-containing protein [Pseudomonadota bacterium]MEC8515588.1 3-hydroxyacyl-CoA dehydrogenase NAD-binding domain-containing protein [Pseudomonadota bacterium]|tara:strand:- start:2738 stop:4807 length:2070 start_codon:yes stop_codon:yes gene_type:complete
MSVQHYRNGRAAVIEIDRPPVNAINHDIRTGLVAALTAIAGDDKVERIILSGAGDVFAAGADAGEFGLQMIQPDLPAVVAALEAVTVPVIAVIKGVCLGGGLELALACRWRIASPTARLGLPEVILGVVPGSGGTQRLPRLVGMKAALSMIPTGRHVGAAEALEIGLIDQQEEDPFAAALAMHLDDLDARPPISKLPPPRSEPEIAEAALVKARRRMPRQSAPEEAVRLVELAASHSFEDGLEAERATFLRLRDGDECRALRHIFFAERGARAPARLKAVRPASLANTVVIGGGSMGAGIAHALARAGSAITLIERDDEAVHAARLRMSGLYEAAVKRGLITVETATDEQSAIRYQSGYDDIEEAGLVIEAVFEDMQVKCDLLKALDKAAPRAVLASNTSYLDIDVMAGCLSDPSRLVGLHFFSPAHIMKLLEIVKGVQTSDHALATGYALAKHLRKIPVEVGVCDGFVGNRMLQRVREAAELLLLDGAEPEQIDRAMRGFGYSMGLYETQDMSGLDIAWANRRRQQATRDPERRYSKVQDQVCEAGWLGRKAGLGWYVYENDKLTGPNPAVAPLIAAEAARHGISRRELSDKAVLQTLMLALINEAANILDEGIARSASDIDLVLVHGYGFPRFRGGPLHYADQLGIQKVREELAILNAGDSLLWNISPLILRLADTNGSFGEGPVVP